MWFIMLMRKEIYMNVLHFSVCLLHLKKTACIYPSNSSRENSVNVKMCSGSEPKDFVDSICVICSLTHSL